MRDPKTMSRRMFLRGTGGAALALPFLPSLLSREAEAAPLPSDKIFVAFGSGHGTRRDDLYPAASTLTQTATVAGYTIKRGALALSNGGVSPVLSSPDLTPALVAKMNVLQGLDMTWHAEHHEGKQTFGNIAQSMALASNPIVTNAANQRRTIDQVMAWSPTFYPSLANVRVRAVVPAFVVTTSYGYSNPQTASGSIVEVRDEMNSQGLFNDLFPTPPSSGVSPKTPLVDRVLENYNRVRQRNRRLSAADKIRLDEHMSRMSELQRRLSIVTSCSAVPSSYPNNNEMYGYCNCGGDAWELHPEKHVAHAQMYNEVVAMGIACGVTRIYVYNQDTPTSFSTRGYNDFHENVAHPGQQAESATSLQELVAMKRLYFDKVVLDMVRRLDAIDYGNGTTALDHALVTWHEEHGSFPHSNLSIPAITFGSAGGFLKTGNYVDYRNQNAAGADGEKPGLPYNQFWGTVLQAMGVAHSEYAETDHGGYGKRLAGGNNYSNMWPDAVWNQVGNVLPLLKA